jgi:hypothetical protein
MMWNNKNVNVRAISSSVLVALSLLITISLLRMEASNAFMAPSITAVRSTGAKGMPLQLLMSSTTTTESAVVSKSVDVRSKGTATTQDMSYIRSTSSWIDLPATAVATRMTQQQQAQLQVLEQTIGRIAMAGAIGIVIKEMYSGQSIAEQIMNYMNSS